MTTDEGNGSERLVKSDQLDPETSLIESESTDVVSTILDCFDGDEEAQNAIIAISGPNKGKDLRDEIGVDQAGYDYIMKRIRRTLAKKFPKGRPL